MPKQSPVPYLVLLGGVGAVAAAAILIRLLQRPPIGMPATVIAAGRLGFAALILLPIALLRAGPELRALRRRDVLLGVASGALLAIHFDMGFLNGSLHHEGGVLFMMAGLCLMYPVLALLVRSEEKKYFDSGVRS